MATVGTLPLAFPTTKGANAVRIIPGNRVGMSIAPFTGKDQVQAFPAQWWEMEISVPPMSRAEAAAFISFKLKLNGPEGQFLLGVPSEAIPRGTASSAPGTPVVDGASQTGTAINIIGAPSGASNYLLEGDWINFSSGLNTRLHKILDDVATTDSVGAFTANIWPPLRESPTNGQAVVVSSAKGIFRLKPGNLNWDIDVALFYGLDIQAREFVF